MKSLLTLALVLLLPGVAFAGNDALLTGPSTAAPETIALDYARRHLGLDVANLKLVARSVSPDGVTHLRFNQVLDGIEAWDSGLDAHVTADGRLITVSGTPLRGARLRDTTPDVSALASLGTARAEAGGPGLPPRVTKRGRTTTFATGELAQLRWIATADGPRLAWTVIAEGEKGALAVVVDAESGKTLETSELTQHAGQARYFGRDPDTGAPLQITMPPAWYDQHAGGARLWGQYARTYIDPNDEDPAPGAEQGGARRQIPASSGTDWLYTRTTAFPGAAPCPASGCSWNAASNSTRTTNERQAATNVHVLTSRYLEHLARAPIGFDAASGSFRGDDYVRAEVNDGEGLDNANFTTWPDGTPPRMQMYLFTTNTNGSDVADVVYHEITHGLSHRLIVNAAGFGALDGLQAEMMGEGWSDFYALDLLAAEGHVIDTAAPAELRVGAHVIPGGIRNKPADCPVDPAGVTGCNGNGTVTSVRGGYTYGDLAVMNNASPHNGGELWAAILWEIRQAVGRTVALELITGGMRMTPDDPTFIDARDAILQQALATRPEHYAAVWRVFMGRGLGAGAATDDVDDTTPTESFSAPPSTLVPREPRISDPYPGGDNDGRAEPGERIEIRAPVFTSGITDISGIRGTVSFTGGVRVHTASAAWPLLRSARAASNAIPFEATMPASCDVAPQLTVSVNGGGLSATATKRITLTQSSDRAVAIADEGTVTSTYRVQSGATVSDVDVRIGELRHSYLGDLEIELSHAGVTVVLFDPPAGWSADDIVDAVFDSDAADAVPGSGDEPLSGRFRPAASLDAFDGTPAGGDWTLRITDRAGGDTGTLREWGVDGPRAQFPCPRLEIPAASTGDAVLAGDGATLTGTVTPNGRATGLRFAWGTTAGYGQTTPVQAVGAGAAAVAGSAAIGGLAPGSTYHYRVEAIRENGQVAVAGDDRTFTVAAPPVVEPPPVAAPPIVEPPAPAFTGRARAKVSKRRVTFSFAVSAPARVRAVVTMAAKGTRKGKRCVAPRKRGRPCTRQVRVATATARAGAKQLRIGKRLRKGRYRATLTVVGTPSVRTLSFRVR